ncbi:MAG: glycosyltransferase family 2 protein, partial [Chloroflexota bacterium]|nr:glycosyltransferase family 2 protein [Chloroflexota bacterium]
GALHAVCTPRTKIRITYWNFAWHGIMSLAERLGLKMPEAQLNWLGMADVDNLLALTDLSTLDRGASLLLPKHVPLLSPLLNRLVIRLPGMRHLALVTHWLVQPGVGRTPPERLSCSVIVPCRNEEGNIADCVARLPDLGTHTEIIFVDGASTDRTRERILKEIERHRGSRDIKLIDQVPGTALAEGGNAAEGSGEQVQMLRLGKGDAVRKGFAAAQGDVLFILDADLTVPPEDLPKFLEPIATGKGDFVNGTRLVYPLEDEAMMPIRFLGNKVFSLVFTWLLGQPIKDTLCGTKVLRRRDYDRLVANRSYFGDFDPFGDFDLLFGAARLGLRIVEVPVRYRRRTSGYSKVKVLQHGPLLARMALIGFRRLKLQRWIERGSANA